jgi:hypothetical protein
MKKNIGWFVAAFIVGFVIFGYFINKTPAAPLELGFRRSSLDSAGLVLQVQNTSTKSLSCRMIAVNNTVQQRADYPFDLGPYKSTEIGILEAGWTFKSGETVKIWCEGFSPVQITVP